MIATSVVCNLDMPGFGKHLDLLRVNTLNELEMCLTEFEVIQRELNSDEVQCEIERGEFTIVWS